MPGRCHRAHLFQLPLPAEMTATGEIVDGKPHIHAVMAVQGDRTIGDHLHQAHIHTSFARAYVIASEHHVAVPAHEQIVFELYPDEGAPADRVRINDTPVALPPPVATGTPPDLFQVTAFFSKSLRPRHQTFPSCPMTKWSRSSKTPPPSDRWWPERGGTTLVARVPARCVSPVRIAPARTA